jgi:hypothetical protein
MNALSHMKLEVQSAVCLMHNSWRGLAWRFAGLAALVTLLQACAGLPPLAHRHEALTPQCSSWWQSLERAIDEAGVRDAEAAVIEGFAGLRTTRMLSALRSQAASSQPAFEAWLERAAQEDRLASTAEIRNLPDSAIAGLRVGSRADALERTDQCRQQGLEALRMQGALRERLLERAELASRYSNWRRAVGLYPLTRWPFFAGVQRWQDQHLSAMKAWQLNTPPLALWRAPFSLDPGPMPTARDALGLPQWSEAQAQAWLAWHAPDFAIETRGSSDRFGRLLWSSSALNASARQAPEIDAARPVVYQRLTATRIDGRWLPQLVYTLWFSERPASGSWDLLAGKLDGLVLRLTLDERGDVLMLDTMHACGCYHLFFAGRHLKPKPDAPLDQEWLFAPADLPALQPGQTLVVQVSSSDHQVMGLAVAERSRSVRNFEGAWTYDMDSEQALRSLPMIGANADPPRRSLYGPDGLVPGTQRGERWLFWPMGIASAGAMRQWGHHATAFVGQRHFDDPDLLDRRFLWVR